MTAFGLSLRGWLRLFDELRSVGQDKVIWPLWMVEMPVMSGTGTDAALPAQRHLTAMDGGNVGYVGNINRRSPNSAASSQP